MTAEDVRGFMREQHHAVLGTLRRDGQPQMSPVLVGIDDDGTMIISTSERTAKTANIRRTGRAWVCAFEDGFYGRWVQAEGPARVESLPEAMDALVRYYRLLAGEHPDWQDYRAAMQRERRVLLRIEIERAAGPS
jgi:PPOX class probable F420-dependent enzyme